MSSNKRQTNLYLRGDLVDKVKYLCGVGRPWSSVSDCVNYMLERALAEYDDETIYAYDHISGEDTDNEGSAYVASDPMAVDLGPPTERITKDAFFYAGEQIAENADISDEDRVKYLAIIRQYQLENGLINRQ